MVTDGIEQENSGHETAFIGIAKIGIMVVSAWWFLRRRNDTITLHTIYSHRFVPAGHDLSESRVLGLFQWRKQFLTSTRLARKPAMF